MTSDSKWFFEHFDSAGSAFGLRIKRKIEERRTPWQHIEMWETDTFGYLMTIDGCTMVTSRDNFLYHEMIAHPALMTHARPERVVIIGGGDCGTLNEVLKHQGVQRVTQIDIDEQVTRLSEKYFPELCERNNDPRAELLFIDGVEWIKQQPDACIDVLIVDSTDPVGPAEGLFKADFFRHCQRILRDGGVLVQQSESPLLHANTIIRDLHINMRQAGFGSSVTLPFPQPIYPSGWWSCTLAGKNCDTRHFRRDATALETRYYTADIHQGALAMPPFLAQALADI